MHRALLLLGSVLLTLPGRPPAGAAPPINAAIGIERVDSMALPDEVLQPTDAITLLPDGSVLLADQPTQLVICVDPRSGKASCRLGSKGSGPGEFRGINFAAVDRIGRIAVVDVALRRVTIFRADRKLETSVNLTGLPGRILHFEGDSLTLDVLGGMTPEVVRINLRNQTSRTLWKPLELDAALQVNSPEGFPSPFLGYAGLANGRVLVWSSWRYRIVAVDGAKARQWSERPEVKPVRLTKEQVEERKRQWEQKMAQVGRKGLMPKIDDSPQPYLMGFGAAVDGANRLWVMTGRGGNDLTVVDVFGEDGAFLTTVNFPYSISTFAIRGSDIAFVAVSPSNPDDAQLLYRYRIVNR